MEALPGMYYLQGEEIAYIGGKFNMFYDGSEVVIGTKNGKILMGKWYISYDENDNPEVKLEAYSQFRLEEELKGNTKLARKLVDAGVLKGDFKEKIEAQRQLEEEERIIEINKRNLQNYLNNKLLFEKDKVVTSKNGKNDL